MVVYVRFQGTLRVTDNPFQEARDKLGLPEGSYIIRHGFKTLLESDPLPAEVAILDMVLLTLGGKGGFGSLLKRKGMKVKIHNFQSSRHISGRRMRDIEAEEKRRALREKKQWEDNLIQYLGGEDPFINQRMSNIEVIQTYKLRLHPQTKDPFEIIEESQPKQPTYFVASASENAKPLEWPNTQVAQTECIQDHDLDLDLDDM